MANGTGNYTENQEPDSLDFTPDYTPPSSDGNIGEYTDGRSPTALNFSPEITPLTVETKSPTDIKETEATLEGELVDMSNYSEVDVYFEYKELEGEETWSSTGTTTLSETGTFSETLTEIKEAIQYEYKAIAETDSETVEGNTVEFMTGGTIPDNWELVDDDSQTVEILSFPDEVGDFNIEILNAPSQVKQGNTAIPEVKITNNLNETQSGTFVMTADGPEYDSVVDVDVWSPEADFAAEESRTVEGEEFFKWQTNSDTEPGDYTLEICAAQGTCGNATVEVVESDDVEFSDIYIEIDELLLPEIIHETETSTDIGVIASNTGKEGTAHAIKVGYDDVCPVETLSTTSEQTTIQFDKEETKTFENLSVDHGEQEESVGVGSQAFTEDEDDLTDTETGCVRITDDDEALLDITNVSTNSPINCQDDENRLVADITIGNPTGSGISTDVELTIGNDVVDSGTEQIPPSGTTITREYQFTDDEISGNYTGIASIKAEKFPFEFTVEESECEPTLEAEVEIISYPDRIEMGNSGTVTGKFTNKSDSQVGGIAHLTLGGNINDSKSITIPADDNVEVDFTLTTNNNMQEKTYEICLETGFDIDCKLIEIVENIEEPIPGDLEMNIDYGTVYPETGPISTTRSSTNGSLPMEVSITNGSTKSRDVRVVVASSKGCGSHGTYTNYSTFEIEQLPSGTTQTVNHLHEPIKNNFQAMTVGSEWYFTTTASMPNVESDVSVSNNACLTAQQPISINSVDWPDNLSGTDTKYPVGVVNVTNHTHEWQAIIAELYAGPECPTSNWTKYDETSGDLNAETSGDIITGDGSDFFFVEFDSPPEKEHEFRVDLVKNRKYDEATQCIGLTPSNLYPLQSVYGPVKNSEELIVSPVGDSYDGVLFSYYVENPIGPPGSSESVSMNYGSPLDSCTNKQKIWICKVDGCLGGFPYYDTVNTLEDGNETEYKESDAEICIDSSSSRLKMWVGPPSWTREDYEDLEETIAGN